jgi:hypothetical protein
MQKIVIKLSKIWFWDPRSGIRKKPIPDPGSRGQKGTGSRIRIRNTAYSDNVALGQLLNSSQENSLASQKTRQAVLYASYVPYCNYFFLIAISF